MQESQNPWIRSIDRYRQLCRRLDERIARIEAIHAGHLVCRPGCCECCVNLTVFAVELYAIAGQLAEAEMGRVSFDSQASCGWLAGGLCRIYTARPIICRTHGLPVVIPNEEHPECGEVSFCPLNFSEVEFDNLFGPDNTLDLTELNEALCRINADFIEAARTDGVELPARIELARLVELLDRMRV